MKKFLTILVVLALTVISSLAFAEINMSGSMDIRNLSLNNTTLDGKAANRTTQERLRLNIDAKSENVKGRITIENDWEVWGQEISSVPGAPANSFEARQGQTIVNDKNGAKADSQTFGFREAWMEFALPGVPVSVKVGHQLLQIGNGWFLRSMKYGSDAWLVTNTMGDNTFAVMNLKLKENIAASTDDTDAYALIDVYKLNDTNTFGADLTYMNDPKGKGTLGEVVAKTIYMNPGTKTTFMNIGLNYNGKIGPVNLKAEVDLQNGTATGASSTGKDLTFAGNQIVLQANMKPMDALTVNATIANGSGDGNSTDSNVDNYVTFLDADPHYTLVYEYFLKGASKAKDTGFSNTQAIGVGANYVISPSLSMNLDIWMLSAVEKVALGDSTGGTTKSAELGTEVDVKINWKLYDTLTWNWTIGKFMPGAAYNTASTTSAAGKSVDDVDAIQGVLSYKF